MQNIIDHFITIIVRMIIKLAFVQVRYYCRRESCLHHTDS